MPINASDGSLNVTVVGATSTSPTPAGSNNIGKVTIDTPNAAIQYAAYSIGTTAAPLIGAGGSINFRAIKNLKANTTTLYIGDANVTTANGFPLEPGESLTLDVKNTSAAIYGVSTAATAVRVLVF
jgi:hypothetical protein